MNKNLIKDMNSLLKTKLIFLKRKKFHFNTGKLSERKDKVIIKVDSYTVGFYRFDKYANELSTEGTKCERLPKSVDGCP